MQQITTLSLVKTYAISALDPIFSTRILTGQVHFSAPLELISDLQFRRNSG